MPDHYLYDGAGRWIMTGSLPTPDAAQRQAQRRGLRRGHVEDEAGTQVAVIRDGVFIQTTRRETSDEPQPRRV